MRRRNDEITPLTSPFLLQLILFIYNIDWNDLGELMGVSYEAVQQYIWGRRNPGLTRFRVLAANLGMPEGYFINLLSGIRVNKEITHPTVRAFEDLIDAILHYRLTTYGSIKATVQPLMYTQPYSLQVPNKTFLGRKHQK
jgi:transcriptional regulator with XRE-family HTH domain